MAAKVGGEGEEAWERGYAPKRMVSHASSPLRAGVSPSSSALPCGGDGGLYRDHGGGMGVVQNGARRV